MTVRDWKLNEGIIYLSFVQVSRLKTVGEARELRRILIESGKFID